MIKYYAFPPVSKDDVVIGIEKVSDMQDELAVLHKEHFAETEVLYRSEPIDVDYEKYKTLELEGKFVVFTARANSRMIGYLIYYIFRGTHTKTVLEAREDAFFLTKECRGNGIAPKLLAYAEDRLGDLHCKYVGMSSKAPVGGPDLDSFLKRRGYKPVAVFYRKKLES